MPASGLLASLPRSSFVPHVSALAGWGAGGYHPRAFHDPSLPAMILLAALALFQVCFLPGWLLLRGVPLRPGLARLLFILLLSLLANYELILVLTALGLCQRPVLLAIIVAELASATWLLWRRRVPVPLAESLAPEEPLGDRPAAFPLRFILLGLAWLSLAWFALIWWRKIPGVFGIGDDLVSWNRWALDWFAGRFPYPSGYYPQLIPANWALIYIVTDTGGLHLFSKLMMGLFPLGLLAALLAAWQATRSLACLAAIPLTAWLLHAVAGLYLAEGWVDLPLAMAFAAAWLVFILHDAGWLRLTHAAALSTLIACSGALMKQGGLFLLAAITLWNLWRLHRAGLGRAEFWKITAALLLTSIVLVAPWYLYKWRIHASGRDNSEWHYQTQELHGQRSYGRRIERATGGLVSALTGLEKSKALTRTAVALFLVLALCGCRRRVARQALALGLPYYLCWAALFSYDRRNVLAALPFLAVAASSGALELGALAKRLPARRRWLWAVSAALAATALLLLNARWSAADFLQVQDRAMRQTGYGSVNTRLYEVLARGGIEGPILTDYQQLAYLPDLGSFLRYFRFEAKDQLPTLIAALPAARHALIRDDAAPELRAYAAVHFTEMFREPPFTFYRLPPP